jgi:hypothetical protein
MKRFRPGDPVVYTKSKVTLRPGPRARVIRPAEHGDTYHYVVDKFWIVDAVRQDGFLVLLTRRGKRHVVPRNDPHLRSPNWWERLLYRTKFPHRGVESGAGQDEGRASGAPAGNALGRGE